VLSCSGMCHLDSLEWRRLAEKAVLLRTELEWGPVILSSVQKDIRALFWSVTR
jgi:hypothetical protein